MHRVLAVALAFLTVTIPLCTASPEGTLDSPTRSNFFAGKICASFSLVSLEFDAFWRVLNILLLPASVKYG